MQEAGALVAEAFALLKSSIAPGVRLRDLDQQVEAFIRSRGALPLYKDYRGNPPTHPPFPGTICASVNQEVCHGIPDDRRLRRGDIVGIDIGLRMPSGFCGDACVTFPVGPVTDTAQKLLKVSQECLYVGIEQCVIANRLGDIGAAIEAHANAYGFTVVREWGGHGVGRQLHEAPSIPHTGPAGVGRRLVPGMVFTVEPMINAGVPEWHLLDDGWTVETADGRLSSQFEHTVAVTRDGPLILSPWHELISLDL